MILIRYTYESKSSSKELIRLTNVIFKSSRTVYNTAFYISRLEVSFYYLVCFVKLTRL